MKKLEIKKTKPTFITSVLKVEYYLGGLSFFDFQLFTNETSLENKWMSFSSSNSALVEIHSKCKIILNLNFLQIFI